MDRARHRIRLPVAQALWSHVLSADTPAETGPQEAESNAEPVTLLRTDDLTQLAVVRSLLEAHGVRYTVRGEDAVQLFPLLPGGLFGPRRKKAELQVRRDDLETATALLEGVGEQRD